jgi:hypothetical protein
LRHHLNVSLWINLAVVCVSPLIRTSQADPKPSLTPDPVKHLRQNPWLEVVPVLTVARVESSSIIVARSRPRTTLGRILLSAAA